MSLTNEVILTITDTLESALDNAQDLLNYAKEDGDASAIETLSEAVADYQRALDEFSQQFSN